MDLHRALAVMRAQTWIPGRSDLDLMLRVMGTPGFATAKALSPAPGLHGGVGFRPAEVLHLLSYATRPRYQADLHDIYVQWGLLRYLGFFGLKDPRHPAAGLEVSAAGRRITGNQRRVTSEELGIGFGVLLGLHWFGHNGAVGVPMTVVDIDAALDDRYVFAAGTRRAVRQIGSRRPDYLLIAHDPSMRTRYRVRVLECKGTKTPSYAKRQLAQAVGQLDGVSVGGRVPSGLAVSTITSDEELSYLALDPADEEEPTYEVPPAMIEQAGEFRLQDEIQDLSAGRLIGASVRASWATLADFGGNLDALNNWAPTVMRNRLVRQPRDRVTFDTPYGTARGTSVTFTFDGARLTVRHAIDEEVDRQLSQQSAEPVSESQSAFADRLSRVRGRELETDRRNVFSATTDGSIFSLTVEDPG